MPPLVATAVNVFVVPWQIVVPFDELMETEAATLGLTVIVTALLVALGIVTHVRELVSTQLTTSPFCKLLLE